MEIVIVNGKLSISILHSVDICGIVISSYCNKISFSDLLLHSCVIFMSINITSNDAYLHQTRHTSSLLEYQLYHFVVV